MMDTENRLNHQRKTLRDGVVVMVLLLLAGVVIWQNAIWPAWVTLFGAKPALVVPRGDLADDEQATIQLFNTASPSVVHITTNA